MQNLRSKYDLKDMDSLPEGVEPLEFESVEEAEAYLESIESGDIEKEKDIREGVIARKKPSAPSEGPAISNWMQPDPPGDGGGDDTTEDDDNAAPGQGGGDGPRFYRFADFAIRYGGDDIGVVIKYHNTTVYDISTRFLLSRIGVSWDQMSYSSRFIPGTQVVEFTVYGEKEYYLFVQGIGTVYTKMYRITGTINVANKVRNVKVTEVK